MRAVLARLVAATMVPCSANAAEPVVTSLARVGPWVANYDNDSCQLIASFGTGPTAITARFIRYQPADTFNLLLSGNPLKRDGTSATLKGGFGPGLAYQDMTATLGTSGGKPLMILTQRLDGWTWSERNPEAIPPPVAPAQEAAIQNFTIQLSRSKTYRLELGSMGKPMVEMRKCMDMLQAHWGYDPKVVAALSRPVTPIGSPGNWLNSNDYPAKALAGGHNGIVQFRLDVDEAGGIANCHILAHTNPDDFATTTCRAIQRRARLLPALDADGKPVKGYYINKVRFMVP